MTIDLQRLPDCSALLTVSATPEAVRSERASIVSAFARQARLPGYRPGKAPAQVVETRFREDIESELLSRLVSSAVRQARDTHSLRILEITDVKPEFAPDSSFECKITLTLAPDFELPEYTGLKVKAPSAEPAPEEVDRFLENLRERDSAFDDITGRPAAAGDFAVTDAEGFLGGKPLAELFPGLPKNVASHKGLWIRLEPDVFLPGFTDHITGMAIGETKEFDLAIPADFPLKDLAGETVRYRVTLTGLKSRRLPELNDDFARRVGKVETLQELREKTADIIRLGKLQERAAAIRRQVEEQLLASASFEVPPGHVRSETRRIVDSIVEENTSRGVSEEVLKQHSGEIVSSAAGAAEKAVRLSFILQRIAEKENIKLTDKEFEASLALLARREGRDPKALRRSLEKNGAIHLLRERFNERRALDFVVDHAVVTDEETPADPQPGPAAQTS